MPGSVTAPASLITRLPSATLKDSQGNALSYTWQSKALQRLSRNANAPGGSLRQNGRAPVRLLKRWAEFGIVAIESNVTGALAANVGSAQPPNTATLTLDTNAGTPATVDITTGEEDAITWAGAGTKLLTVTVPATSLGQALVTV